MNASRTDLSEVLPYLRRYAHALVGSPSKGDAYLKLCLETYLHEPHRLRAGRSIKPQLFALFHDVWSVVALTMPQLDEAAEDDTPDDPLAIGLQCLPVLKRQVFLLGRLEGFSTSEIAAILGIDEVDARRRLDEATALLRRRMIDRHLLQGGSVRSEEDDDAFDVPLQAPSFVARRIERTPSYQR